MPRFLVVKASLILRLSTRDHFGGESPGRPPPTDALRKLKHASFFTPPRVLSHLCSAGIPSAYFFFLLLILPPPTIRLFFHQLFLIPPSSIVSHPSTTLPFQLFQPSICIGTPCFIKIDSTFDRNRRPLKNRHPGTCVSMAASTAFSVPLLVVQLVLLEVENAAQGSWESKHLWNSALAVFLSFWCFVVIFASSAPTSLSDIKTDASPRQYHQSWLTTEQRAPCPRTWETADMRLIRRTSVKWAAVLRTSQVLMASISRTTRMQSAL